MKTQPISGSAVLALSALLVGLKATSTQAQSFQGLGFAPGSGLSYAYKISTDGTVVVGDVAPCGTITLGCQPAHAMRWSAATGMVDLGTLPGGSGVTEGLGVNGDGSVVVGYDGFGGVCSPNRPWSWTAATGLVFLGFVPGSGSSMAWDVSADGTVIAGDATPCGGNIQAALYTAATGWTTLGFLPGAISSEAFGISGDGTVLVGHSNFPSGNSQAFRWTQATGMVGLGFLSGSPTSVGWSTNADGTVAVGWSGYPDGTSQAFRWTASSGMVGLGYLPGTNTSNAYHVNSTGTVVVGTSGGKAFRWTATDGMNSIENLLTAAGVSFTGWNLLEARGVSGDGTVIAGAGRDPSGKLEAWIATIPLPCVTQSGAGTTYTLVGGGTQTVSGNINGETITVTGNGTLALARNANDANITVNSPCVTVTLAQNFNNGVFTDQSTPPGRNKVLIGGNWNGATFRGGSQGSGGVFTIGQNANGASFTFTSSDHALSPVNLAPSILR